MSSLVWDNTIHGDASCSLRTEHSMHGTRSKRVRQAIVSALPRWLRSGRLSSRTRRFTTRVEQEHNEGKSLGYRPDVASTINAFLATEPFLG